MSCHESLAESEERELSRPKLGGKSDPAALLGIVLQEGLFDEADSLPVLRASRSRLGPSPVPPATVGGETNVLLPCDVNGYLDENQVTLKGGRCVRQLLLANSMMNIETTTIAIARRVGRQSVRRALQVALSECGESIRRSPDDT